MAKHKKDIGLQYIQKIHANGVKSIGQLTDQLGRRYGADRVLPYTTTLLGDPEISGIMKDYPFDLEAARAVYGAADADLIRQSVNYIHKHHDAFGQEILEVGCGMGFLTGFLALEFPDAQITAIDRDEHAIEATGALLKELGVDNVTLLHTDLQGHLKTHAGGYDTVFTSRTLQDNYDPTIKHLSRQDLWTELRTYYLPLTCPFAILLGRAVRPKGTLITLLQEQPTPEPIAWMADLRLAGFLPDQESYTRIPCRGLFVSDIDQSHTITLQATVSRQEKGATPLPLDGDGHLSSPIPADYWPKVLEAVDLWKKPLDLPLRPFAHYMGAEACYLAATQNTGLIRGVGFFDREGHLQGKYCLYDLKGHPELFAHFADANGRATLLVVDRDELSDHEWVLKDARSGEDELTAAALHDRHLRAYWLKVDPDTGLEVNAER